MQHTPRTMDPRALAIELDQGFAFDAYTVRTLDELRALEPQLREARRPLLIDCTINGAIAAPFVAERAAAARSG